MLHPHVSKGLLVALGFFLAAPAQARIVCHGDLQVIPGHGEVSTPYCENANLAAVARSYGMRVSAAEIRNSPSTKQHVCHFIGHDNRVKDACIGYMPDDKGWGH